MKKSVILIVFSIAAFVCLQSCSTETESTDKVISKDIKTTMPVKVNKANKGVLSNYTRIKKKTATKIQKIGNKQVQKNPVRVSKDKKFITVSGYAFDDKNKGLSKDIYISMNKKVYKCETNISNAEASKKYGKKYEMSGFKKVFRTAQLKKGKYEVKIISADISGSGIYLPGNISSFILE